MNEETEDSAMYLWRTVDENAADYRKSMVDRDGERR